MRIELRKTVLILLALLLTIPVQAAYAISIDTPAPTTSGSSLRFQHTYNLSDIPAGKVLEFVVYSKSQTTGNLVVTTWVSKIPGGSSGPGRFSWDQAANQERWVKVFMSSSTDSTNQRRQDSNIVYACHMAADGSYDCGAGVSTPPGSSSGGTQSLNIMTVPDGNGNVTLSWSPVDGAAGYQVIQNGQVVENLTPNTSVTIPNNGQVRVIAFDDHSQVITSEEMQLGDTPIDPTNPTDPLEKCSTAICNCINQLKPVLDQIDQNTGGMLGQVGQLLAKTDEVKAAVQDVKQAIINESSAIRQEIRSLHNEFVPNQQNNIPLPDNVKVPKLEDNKPPMREGVFTDNTTYFSDQGEAAAPPAFPQAPEPSSSWDDGKGGTITKQQPLTKEPVRTREPVKQRDPVKQKDQPLQRDPVPTKDTTDYKQQLRWRSDQYKP